MLNVVRSSSTQILSPYSVCIYINKLKKKRIKNILFQSLRLFHPRNTTNPAAGEADTRQADTRQRHYIMKRGMYRRSIWNIYIYIYISNEIFAKHH